MDTEKLLLEFSSVYGVAGRESEAADYAVKLLEPYGKVSINPLGSVICTVREPAEGEAHFLLDAHIDEIGLIVTYIDKEGFLRVGACGGIDRRLLLASPVVVHTVSGAIPGVVCSIPPHLSGSDEKKNPKVEDIYIDIGLSGDQAKESVKPGDIVTLQSASQPMLGGLVSGKAIDDRAGCVAHLKALEYLGDAKLSCGLTVQFSSLEEVGGQGAKTSAYTVNPTHCIAVDVSFAHTPDAEKEKCGELKKGPMIGFSPILNAEMSTELIDCAKENDIPYQYEVMGGKTGTNADDIATTRGGVKTALISIPQKYMHTPIEAVAVQDVEDTGRLIAAYIKNFGQGNL